MNITETGSYIDYQNHLQDVIRLKSSSMIISLPGMGISYFSDKFIEAHNDLNIKRIKTENEDLADFNILDLDFDKNKNALGVADKLFKKATGEQKFAVVINTPYLIHTDQFRDSYMSSRMYKKFFFKVFDKTATAVFLRDIDPNASDEVIDKIQTYTGGIARLSKYFVVNPEKIDLTTKEIIVDEDFKLLFHPTVAEIQRTHEKDLEAMGIKQNGQFTSKLIESHFSVHAEDIGSTIKLFKDLSFSENENMNPDKLIRVERDILRQLLKEGVITREKIADLKWGQGSYDKFSDQAINKTVQRLNRKMKEHQIASIPKVGYKLEAK